MRNVFAIWIFSSVLTACSGAQTPLPVLPVPSETPLVAARTTVMESSPTAAPTAVPTQDFFAQMGIALQAPVCTSFLEPQTEGPYFKPDTPERNSLLEEGMQGERLILVGYVLDQDCQPLPRARLDFWQADCSGEYDNADYRLRGHQFTDSQGRYYLETILPGLYGSRPIEHIHVKVQPEGGREITSQLYFPGQPVDGLTVTLAERDGDQVGYFNFVILR